MQVKIIGKLLPDFNLELTTSWVDSMGGSESATKEIIKLRDALIEEALASLGWVPPGKVTTSTGEVMTWGDDLPADTNSSATAGIKIGNWVNRIECYGHTPAEANLLRNDVLMAMSRPRHERAYPSPLGEGFVDPLDTLLAKVKSELVRARSLFPGDKLRGYAAIEEFGEFFKALLDEQASAVEKEGVQAMAMIARIILEGDSSLIEHRKKKGLDKLV